MLARKYRSSREHFRQYATNRPNVYGLGIALNKKNMICWQYLNPTSLILFKCAHTHVIQILTLITLELSIISGALYHLVATYSVRKPAWLCSGSATLAKPKSQILRSQVVFNNKLLGFKSLCNTFAECMYFKPRNIWYRK